MKLHKLESTDAFVVFDLDDAPRSAGIVRLAPKILTEGATMLARTVTYAFASFEQQIGGASAGINAKPDDRSAAIAAFVGELGPLVHEGRLVLDAGKGVGDDDLAPLREASPEPFDHAMASDLLTAGVIAASNAVRPLDGARVLIDGLDRANVDLLAALTGQGARVIGLATLKGAVLNPAGLDVTVAADAIRAEGPEGVYHLGDVHPIPGLFATEADVVLAGSKSGVIDDGVAETMHVAAVVPIAPVPVTAKALATLRRAGAAVVPDFLSASGPVLAHAPGGTTPEAVAAGVEAVLGEVAGHEDGPLLAACYRAETFLRTWRDTLPFGRPLA